jgi:hypothetical protein
MFALSLIFTMLAVNDRKELPFKWIAAMLWFIFSVVHFIVGEATVLTYALCTLWMGFGLIFTFLGISSFFEIKKEKIWSFKD